MAYQGAHLGPFYSACGEQAAIHFQSLNAQGQAGADRVVRVTPASGFRVVESVTPPSGPKRGATVGRQAEEALRSP